MYILYIVLSTFPRENAVYIILYILHLVHFQQDSFIFVSCQVFDPCGTVPLMSKEVEATAGVEAISSFTYCYFECIFVT